MTCPVTPARPDEPDFLESYEQVVDDQLAEEAREAEDEGTASYLTQFLE